MLPSTQASRTPKESVTSSASSPGRSVTASSDCANATPIPASIALISSVVRTADDRLGWVTHARACLKLIGLTSYHAAARGRCSITKKLIPGLYALGRTSAETSPGPRDLAFIMWQHSQVGMNKENTHAAHRERSLGVSSGGSKPLFASPLTRT